MKAIEIIDANGRKCTIYVKYIHGLIEIDSNTTKIVMDAGKFLQTETPYQEVKDAISACYGGEDEED